MGDTRHIVVAPDFSLIHSILQARARPLNHRVETQFVTTADVAAGQLLGFGFVMTRNRGHYRLMLVPRFRDTTRRSKGGATEQRDGVVQILQALDQKPIMSGVIDALMEERIFARMDFWIVRQLTMQIQHRLQHANFGGIGAACGQRSRGALQALAHIVELSHRTQVMLRHHQTSARRMNQHAIRLQSAHRFANWSAADLQPRAKFQLRNALAGLELTFLDRIADGAVGPLGQAPHRSRRAGAGQEQKSAVRSSVGTKDGSLPAWIDQQCISLYTVYDYMQSKISI